MRIVWKDSARSTARVYRGYEVYRFENGWVTNHPQDHHIYYSVECAYNALDEILGGNGRKGVAKYRQNKGVVIVGTKC